VMHQRAHVPFRARGRCRPRVGRHLMHQRSEVFERSG
jgi:hypothetical protein